MELMTHVASSPQIHHLINNIPSQSNWRREDESMRTMQMALGAFVVTCVCCTSKNTAVLISMEATFPTLTDYCVSGGWNLGERPLQ